jgi:peptidyl-prolyl cis-trans isomerase D
MITWMQRHRKYLVITIWVSTFAFIGAGFVGWGQYRYGDQSGAVAKVGDVSITGKEFQQAYSQLFNQYAQMFRGQFDEAQAKKFGLDKQALRRLIDEALLVNLANSYNLEATDAEVAGVLQKQQAFAENGVFSKTLYQQVLKQNHLAPAEYEAGLRKSILIQKLFALFPITADAVEKEAFETALGIADKLEYKVLSGDSISIDTSDAALKAYWEAHKNDYMTARAFKIAYITQARVASGATAEELKSYYDAHTYDFVGPDGKLLAFEKAKSAVAAAMDDKATNKAALRTYIAFKKEKLADDITVTEKTVTANDTPFSAETMQAIATADKTKPYLKPKKEGGEYVIIKVAETIPPVAKTFEAAKADVLAAYSRQMRSQKLLETANGAVDTFKGATTDGYVVRTATEGFKGLDSAETQALLATVFKSDKAQGIAGLPSGRIVLFRILDQKIESEKDPHAEEAVIRSKTALFNRGLITALSNRYETQVFMKGFGQ